MQWTELEAAWVQQLVSSWREINSTYFKNAMQLPSLLLSDSSSHLGLWNPAHRSITLAKKLFKEQPWGVILEVLKHEMAHQFVHEVLRVTDETAHGPAFRQVCERHGIDADPVGMPSANATEDVGRARILQRVTKLLALAESQNEHEAHAAMAAAQKLMLHHNLQIAGTRRYSFRHLGKVKARTFEPERRISVLLGEHFFVDAIWVPSFDALTGKAGRVLEVCGSAENLDMAEYVHGFLLHTMDRLWREHKKSHALQGDGERMAYCAGVIQGFSDNLAEKRKVNKEQGLIWLGDADLDRYHRARHPYIRHTRHQGARGDSRAHGREAGRKLVLHKPVQTRGTTGGLLGF